MARTKGMLNLSGNIEVLAGAPFDARELVPTKADLTVASNFPYPYVGMETYVTAEDKKYRYMGGDITDLANWVEVGSGGGQTYNDFTGATSSTAGAHGLVPAPSAGDEGKVLFGNGAWGALPSVDLSVLSNEAFQFSPIEKPVGTWTDSNNVTKILYAKTVDCGALPNNNFKRVAHNISNLEAVHFLIGSSKSSTDAIPINFNWTDNLSSTVAGLIEGNNIVLGTGTDRSSYTASVTIFYTKTTDSPLPSDVKFAGVTASGEVILRREVTFSSAITMPSNEWVSTGISSAGVGQIRSCMAFRSSDGMAIPVYADGEGAGTTFEILQTLNRSMSNVTGMLIEYTLTS